MWRRRVGQADGPGFRGSGSGENDRAKCRHCQAVGRDGTGSRLGVCPAQLNLPTAHLSPAVQVA